MSKWEIDKTFHFEAGHRVFTQRLDRPDLSLSTDCACKNLHGHSYTIKVCLTSDKLDDRGFVIDFKELNFVKQFIDDVLDHKFMIGSEDPLFKTITNVDPPSVPNFTNLGAAMGRPDDPYLMGFVVVNFCPTSENICKHLRDWVQAYLGDYATVSAIDLWETQKSHCRYTA